MKLSIFSVIKICVFVLIGMLNNCWAETKDCSNDSLKVQVLGSGGPELTKNRASSSYLVWLNQKAIILIDAGGGSALRYGETDADWKDLKAVLFSHFHADHSSDFAALVKASWFGDRDQDLPVFGPYGNSIMPSTSEFLSSLFDYKKGAYKYLSDFFNHKDDVASYRLLATNISDKDRTQLLYSQDGIKIHAQQVQHGPIPAMAYVINICGKSLVYSGDTNAKGFDNLKIDQTDVFIAHNAIPENAGTPAQSLHMTPSQIGKLAHHLNTKKLVLSHRMKRSLGKESQTLELIKKLYKGTVEFANDLDIFYLTDGKSLQ